MKRIILLALAFMLIGGVCSAETWEKIGELNICKNDKTVHYQYFIDADSIKTLQSYLREIAKARIKVAPLDSNEVIVELLYVDKDTREFTIVVTDIYTNNKLSKQYVRKEHHFQQYDPNNKAETLIIEEILKRAK